MNTAREILKQADDLKLDQAEMEKLTAAIARQLDGTNWEVSFGFGWFPIPVSVMHVIRDGVEARLAQLADEIYALEARVLVVES